MKLFRNISIFAFVAACAALGSVACSDDDGIDNREHDYGYVQFKLYKEGSQPALQSLQSETRADGNNEEIVDQLDMLAQAAKLQVTLKFGNTEIAQTLTLSAANSASAEFGLRSEKLQLLSGDYQIISFKLYNINDIAIYNGRSFSLRSLPKTPPRPFSNSQVRSFLRPAHPTPIPMPGAICCSNRRRSASTEIDSRPRASNV